MTPLKVGNEEFFGEGLTGKLTALLKTTAFLQSAKNASHPAVSYIASQNDNEYLTYLLDRKVQVASWLKLSDDVDPAIQIAFTDLANLHNSVLREVNILLEYIRCEMLSLVGHTAIELTTDGKRGNWSTIDRKAANTWGIFDKAVILYTSIVQLNGTEITTRRINDSAGNEITTFVTISSDAIQVLGDVLRLIDLMCEDISFCPE